MNDFTKTTTRSEGGSQSPETGLAVAIIGGRPIGLAAAAQLAQLGEPFVLFESGERIASNVRGWAHVRVFSPWRYNMDQAAQELLRTGGWQMPDLESLPTGQDLIDQYLEPLANLPGLKNRIYLGARVISVGRKGLDKVVTKDRDTLPFVLQVQMGGKIEFFEARAVIDASGTWANPNPIGSGGVPAPGEAEAQERIFYGIPDVLGRHKSRYAGKRTLVVGSGHSAINVLLELIELSDENPETEIFWALRKKQMQSVYGGEDADALPARGALGSRIRAMVEAGRLKVISPFHISLVTAEEEGLHVAGKLDGCQFTLTGVDEIIANTGSRPDTSISREVRVAFDPVLESVPALAPLIDPNVHSCGTVRPHGEAELRQPEKDYYVVGVKSYGRAPTFLLATGHEQVRSVAAALTGNWEEAARVELSLPESGVCSSDLSADGSGAACCGALEACTSSPSQNSDASCCGSAQPVALSVGGGSS